MIKIIKPGTRLTTKCEKCGCEFSFEEEDIQSYNYNEFGIGGGGKFVRCPQTGCGEKIILETTR